MYLGVLGIGYNTELAREEEARRRPRAGRTWSSPSSRAKCRSANPNASGTAYLAIATLVQVIGEEEAFKYLKALHKNINTYPRSGTAPDQGGGARRDAGQQYRSSTTW